MPAEMLEDQLRRATRNFTSRLPEDQVFALGLDLARELQRAHAETPARHPSLDPAAVPLVEGRPRLEGGGAGSVAEDLFSLGALLSSLALGAPAEVGWRLDGPPGGAGGTLLRRSALAALGSPGGEGRFPTAEAAALALQRALAKSAPFAAPWPLFRGDLARTGSRAAPSAARGLLRLWEAAIGPVTATPLPVGPFVVVPACDGRVVFLDREHGFAVHETRVASAIESTPALAGDRLYLGTDDGELVGIEIADGSVASRLRLGQVVRSSPLVAEGRAYVGVLESKTAGALVAVDLAGGKVLWKQKLGAVFSSPALQSGVLLVGSDDGSLHALDAAKGERLWSRELGGKVRATPAVAGEVAVAAGFGGRAAAARVADGAEVWSTELGHPVFSSPCASSGLCVFGCNEGHVHALELGAGKARFEVATRGPVIASAAAAGDRFVIGSTDGELYLIDAAGSVLARERLAGGGISSSASLAEEVVYVGTAQGVCAVRLVP